MELVAKLERRAAEGNPIRVGTAGCGQMGSGLAHTINHIPGMVVAAIADIDPKRGIRTFAEMGHRPEDIFVTERVSEACDAVPHGQPVVSHDALLLPNIEPIDANVEATGIPDIGALVAYHSIIHSKPIIMLNVETDVTIGLYLNQLARRMGSVYKVTSGDEPGVLKMMWEQARLMGFEVVALGKGKNNPIDTSMTPDQCAEEAHSKGMNPKVLCSFIDGTKTMVEIAAVSNATGLLPDVPGMNGPRVELEELASTFIPRSDGGIFSAPGRIDYSTGGIAPGVFAIVYSDDAHIRKDMEFITRAEGPYYLLFRPYHLCDLETPQSIAEAVLLGEVTLAADEMHSEAICAAKRTIGAGEKVSGLGSADWYETIHTREDPARPRAISFGAAAAGRALKEIRKGEIFTEWNFALDNCSFIFKLRALQDALLCSGRLGC
jgi:predicted homoserine dehydrogenase-like protein